MKRIANNLSQYTYKTWLPLLLAGCTAFGMLVGYRMSEESVTKIELNDDDMVNREFDDTRLTEILKYIDARYVDTVDRNILLDSATDAIFNQLDPHSVYIPPEDLAEINEGMTGFYKGLGIETILFKDTLRIINILDGSPAEKSGLQYGDKIIAINDSIIAGIGMSKTDQWSLLRISKKNKIKLSLENFDGDIFDKEIISAKVKSPNVDFFAVDDITYIGIKKFSDNTYEEIIDAFEKAQKDMEIPNLIIDLRDNPGGYLPEATKILNQLFVEDKRLLVYTKDKNNRKSEYNTTGRPFYKVKKLAVLINENSASASEIIAGALQDWDKAIIIGQKSYGKGLVQEQYNLSNGGAIRLTTARYYTPSGRFIQTPYNIDTTEIDKKYLSKQLNRELIARGGILPDKTVSWTEDELDLIYSISSEKHTLVYEFIEDNMAESKRDRLILKKDWEDNLKELLEKYCFENKLSCDKNFPLVENLIKETIYEHLDNEVKSDSIYFQYDIMIQSALESLKSENIFTELKEESKY